MAVEGTFFMPLAKPGNDAFSGHGNSVHRDLHQGTGTCTLRNAFYDFNGNPILLGTTGWVQLVEPCFAQKGVFA